MAVHPQVQTVLDMIAGQPDLDELPIEQSRENLKAIGAQGAPIHAVEDREVPGPAGPIPIRIYRPSDDTPLPVVVYIHGGGFSMGDLDSHDALCRELANASGCIFVAVDYALAPERPFPQGIDDSYVAAAWIHEHASEFGGDPDRLAIAGDSGGATFATTVCMMARDQGGPPLRFQVLINPGGMDYDYSRPSCVDCSDGYFLTLKGMRWIEGIYFAAPEDRDGDWRAEAGFAPDVSNQPPAIVLTAEYDPVRDQGRAYVQRLRDAGVEVQHTDYPGMIHGWINMFHVIDDGRKGIDEIADALRKAFP